MDAKKCDRCKRYYEPYSIADSHMTRTGDFEYNVKFNNVTTFTDKKHETTYDLCPECAKAFNKWINNQ